MEIKWEEEEDNEKMEVRGNVERVVGGIKRFLIRAVINSKQRDRGNEKLI